MKAPAAASASPYVTPSSIDLEIDEAAFGPIMQMLSKLYNDPSSAVLRELVSNGVDAHRAAGVQALVDVRTTASHDDPTMRVLAVRDFGDGLAQSDIASVFASYGRSTKAEDNSAIGGFGIGSKSPLALSDHFFITSYHQGAMSKAVFAVGASGKPSLSYLVNSEPSDEPSGVLVEVEISAQHEATMIQRAAATFGLFEPGSVAINGEVVASIMQNALRIDRFASLVPRRRLPEHMHSNSMVVEYAGVHYPMPSSMTVDVLPMAACLVIHAPRGTLMPSPSRESLEDRASNIETLTRLTRHMRSRIDRAVQSFTELANSPRDAALRRARFVSSTSSFIWHRTNYSMMLSSPGFSMLADGKTVTRHSGVVPVMIGDMAHVVVFDGPLHEISNDAARVFMNKHGISKFIVVRQGVGSDEWLSWGHGESGVVVVDHSDFVATVRQERRRVRELRGPARPTTYACYFNDHDERFSQCLAMREITTFLTDRGVRQVWLVADSWSGYDTAARAPGTAAIQLNQRNVTNAAVAKWRTSMAKIGVDVGTRQDLSAYLDDLAVTNASDVVMKTVLSKRLLSSDVPQAVLKHVTSPRVRELLSGMDADFEREVLTVRSAMMRSHHWRDTYRQATDINDTVPGMRELLSSTLAISNPSLVAHLIDLIDKETHDGTP